MATATVIPTPTAPVPSIPFAPAGLLEWQARAIAHSGDLATARGLRLIGRGRCRVPGHVGAPVYVVSSASRPTGSHLVWIERGRIHCDCEGRTLGRAFTCSHAQFVRLLIVAELADARSVPPIARQIAPAPVEPAPEPEPEPPAPAPAPAPTRRPRKRAAKRAAPTPSPAVAPESPASTVDAGGPDRQPCPSCGALTDAAELAELGECLNCLQMRADFERAEERAVEEWAQAEAEQIAESAADRLPCWCCGQPATAETDHGLYCDACVTLSPSEQRRRSRARLAEEKIAKTRAAVAQRTAQRAPTASTAPTATAITAQQREAARRERARMIGRERRRADTTADPDRLGAYNRRPFSVWKSEQRDN